MNVVAFDGQPEPSLNNRLLEFEQLFDYPLTSSVRFSIKHEPDYSAFFRALGAARTVVAEIDGEVVAVLASAIRTVVQNQHAHKVAYFGDLKIHPEFRSGRLLYALASEMKQRLTSDVSAAYAIAMSETAVLPERYTGRVGIPLFRRLHQIKILRIECAHHEDITVQSYKEAEGYHHFENVAGPGPIFSKTQHTLRSELEPRWFLAPGAAAAMVEDTRKAKRLFTADGQELLSAHISNLAFTNASDASKVIKACLGYAADAGYPAAFVALDEAQTEALASSLKQLQYEESAATMYATDPMFSSIRVNTAEI